MLMITCDLSFMEEGRINNWPYTKYILKPLYLRKEDKFPMAQQEVKKWY